MDHLTITYSSLGRRFVAVLLDALILMIPCAIAARILPVVGGVIIAFLYTPVFEASAAQATIGKQLMGIQVSDLNGRRISFRAAVVRFFMKFVSSVLFFLGYLIAVFTAKKQTLHDLVADTVVIYGRSEVALADAWMNEMRSLLGSKEAGRPCGSRSATYEELEKLQSLRERGAITEEEFQREKARLLSSGS